MSTDLETIAVTRRPLRLAEWRRMAVERDYSRVVRTPARLVDRDTGATLAAYLTLPPALGTAPLVAELRKVEINWFHRIGGMDSTSRTFGASPRDPRNVRYNDSCSVSKLAREAPEAHRLLVGLAPTIAALYAELNPELAARHTKMARAVREGWHMKGTMYTSGIINRDAQLPYHFDSGNHPGGWSAMLGFRHDLNGGHLVLPGYDLALEIADRSLTLFDGQATLHGVTPLVRTSLDAYRFTIVYYSLERMWNCLPPSLEQERDLHR